MHPYSGLPARHFWKRFVSETAWRDLPFNDRPKFRIARGDRIATAGSCFAQHISRHLAKVGIGTYRPEAAHPLIGDFGAADDTRLADSYQLFSCRYGNLYTTRQCLELFEQAFGLRPMIEDFAEHDGRVYDLLRPTVPAQGFSSLAEARADRAYHLGCVRRMFENADVFVFTLGLTESWYHAEQGHTYPMCPGTARGHFDPALHRFRNLSCAEVSADLEALIGHLARVNPRLRLLLTVSPVPLVATNSPHNVLVASSHSKAVLRAACGEVEARHAHVQYFPSYEIISHAASFGQYLHSDLREVTERGVGHVMACFLASVVEPAGAAPAEPAPAAPPSPPAAAHDTDLRQALQVECDELMNELVA